MKLLVYSQKREIAVLSEAASKWALHVVKENGYRRTVHSLSHVLQVGDVIFVEKLANTNNTYRLQQIPKVEGAIVAMEPHTGRVLAMVGGFSLQYLSLIVQHKLIVRLVLHLSP